MQSQTFFFVNNQWQHLDDVQPNTNQHQLVLVFADRYLLETKAPVISLRNFFPNACIISCSTAGEIYDNDVYDGTAVAVALNLEKTTLKFSFANIADFKDSHMLGTWLAAQLPPENLRYVLAISDGGKVNGSELMDAINENISEKVPITGGMAGDGARFEKTFVGMNDNIAEGNVVLAGFYGNHLQVGYGLSGGWDVFGPERIITKSNQNILYDIDNQNALGMYKKYLGKYADELPGAALLFPLAIKNKVDEEPVVRTILAIDEHNQTMIFAGNLPEGSAVRLMKANFDKLIFSAGDAAAQADKLMNMVHPQLVLMISCVGRKLVLGKRINEEVEAVADIFPGKPLSAGFYSYGEFSPMKKSYGCELHNQTMTITTLAEL